MENGGSGRCGFDDQNHNHHCHSFPHFLTNAMYFHYNLSQIHKEVFLFITMQHVLGQNSSIDDCFSSSPLYEMKEGFSHAIVHHCH
ncbi:hypothetical protein COLO4_15665 [Corchorus olitorius]|uniref:Uncharacterized protein n=1 Tax=Corchorus olitorius TaxID=93759 RepID=A0A1R3JLT3_9ROSI|nr:hypothetical protein COLO4_15665 [Corchorus olitorius]